MSAGPPSYPPSNQSNASTGDGDDMTLTNPTNPRASVAPSTEKFDSASSSTDTNLKSVPPPPQPPPSPPPVDPLSTDITAIPVTTRDFDPSQPEKSHAAPSTNDETSLEPYPGLPERKSSVLRPPLPPLPFHLREHKAAVAFVFIVMFIDHGIFPPACYFGLHYATNISLTTIFGIITGIFGVVLGLECFIRSIKLILPSPRFRPLGQTARFGVYHIFLTASNAVATIA
ncbi:hypothetical protein ABW21_db0200648 [Orbilia brochopaga]|nr:hypothetical protein ABW21_db0200648 [Drechslerella brochopaga]